MSKISTRWTTVGVSRKTRPGTCGTRRAHEVPGVGQVAGSAERAPEHVPKSPTTLKSGENCNLDCILGKDEHAEVQPTRRLVGECLPCGVHRDQKHPCASNEGGHRAPERWGGTDSSVIAGGRLRCRLRSATDQPNDQRSDRHHHAGSHDGNLPAHEPRRAGANRRSRRLDGRKHQSRGTAS